MNPESNIPGRPSPQSLSEREELVLRSIVQHYILTANPVGSRFISKRLDEESLSAATIRNVMADLEEKGYISHPHTSAGRVPTDLGYRIYVDTLRRFDRLTQAERTAIRQHLDPRAPAPVLMRETSRLLGAISHQLGVVTAPELQDSVLQRLELVVLSSTRVLVVLAMSAGLVRTITLELHQELDRGRVDEQARVLNERLAGLTLREIRTTFRDRLRDVADQTDGVIRLFLDAGESILMQEADQRVHVSPTQNILRNPEFSSQEGLLGVVELIEDEEVIVHLLENRTSDDDCVEIAIGSELGNEKMAAYSLIATRYRFGDASGTIGLIGPKRMNYSKMISVVEYVARTISDSLGGESAA